MYSSRLRIKATAVVTAVLGLALAGPAAAEVWPDGRSGAQFSTGAPYPDLVERAVASHRAQVLAPDDLRSGLVVRAETPDAFERAVAIHTAAIRRVAETGPVSQSGDRFDWAAAGLGASGTIGILFMVGLGFGVARRFRAHSPAV